MLTGYRVEEIYDYLKDGSAFGVKISYSKDADEGRGSPGALSNAVRKEAIPACETLVVYYVDTLSNLDITSLAKAHKTKHAGATLVLPKGYTLPVGVAKVRDGRFVLTQEKPEMNISVTMDCMILGPRAMRIAASISRKQNSDLISDFVPEQSRSDSVGLQLQHRAWGDHQAASPRDCEDGEPR